LIGVGEEGKEALTEKLGRVLREGSHALFVEEGVGFLGVGV